MTKNWSMRKRGQRSSWNLFFSNCTVGHWYLLNPFLYSIQQLMLSLEQTEIANAPGCGSDGEGYVSNHRNLSIFTSTTLISNCVFTLAMAALRSALCCPGLCPFPLLCPLRLHSSLLPGKHACTGGRERGRERERKKRRLRGRPKTAEGKEHWERRSFHIKS